jgi:hypothetical protein
MLPVTPVLTSTRALSSYVCHFFIMPVLPGIPGTAVLHDHHALLDRARSSHK